MSKIAFIALRALLFTGACGGADETAADVGGRNPQLITIDTPRPTALAGVVNSTDCLADCVDEP